jgi:predicted GIY-YIG superfamily endonuclease
MHYVYLLQRVDEPEQRYVGATSDLRSRLDEHNEGRSLHTSKHAPWRPIA